MHTEVKTTIKRNLLTLLLIALTLGSRSSFIAAFKKFTGMMPKEFMQKTHHKGANPTRKAAGETPEQGKTKL